MTLALIGLLIVEGTAALASGVYIAIVYHQRREDSEYLRRLVVRDWRVAAGAVPILIVVVYSLLVFAFPDRLTPIARPWGSIAVCIPIAVFLYGVVDDARQFYRDRRLGSEPGDRLTPEDEL